MSSAWHFQARQASGDLVDGLVARGVLEVARIAGLDELGTLEEAGKPRHRLYRGYFKLKFGTQFHKDGSPKVTRASALLAGKICHGW